MMIKSLLGYSRGDVKFVWLIMVWYPLRWLFGFRGLSYAEKGEVEKFIAELRGRETVR